MKIFEIFIQIIMILLTIVIAPYVSYLWGYNDDQMIQFTKGCVVLMGTLIIWFVIYAITSRFYKN